VLHDSTALEVMYDLFVAMHYGSSDHGQMRLGPNLSQVSIDDALSLVQECQRARIRLRANLAFKKFKKHLAASRFK
jgi:hypothetical protein